MVVPHDEGREPPARRERIATLDILRGLAVLGMVLAHVHKALGEPTPNGAGLFTTWFVAEKDRAMFAFLFGVGAAIMIRQLERRGEAVVPIFLRRMAALYAIGFAVELSTGYAILREYAWWGVALLFIRHLTTRALLVLAVISVSALSVRDIVDTGLSIATSGRAAALAAEEVRQAEWDATQRREREAVSGGDYAAVVAARGEIMVRSIATLYQFTPKIYLALFILGLLAVRHGLFEAPKAHRKLLLRAMIVGAGIWMVAWWLMPHLPSDLVTPRIGARLRTGLGLIDEQFLAFTYMGGVVLLIAYRPLWATRLSWLSAVGRLALTNYVLHVVVINLLSAPYGFGWRIGPAMEIAGGIALFALLVGFSRIWLRYFEQGPLEWAWRRVTYLKAQPLRLPHAH